MKANQKATEVSQQANTQSDLDVIETSSADNQAMSKDDIRFLGELGWLSAAAVAIAGVAASV